MKLPDTCVWIESLVDSPTGRRYRELFEAPQELLVPTLVHFELRRWALRELGEDDADRILAMTRASRTQPLDHDCALFAADLAGRHRLSSMDALIYASALRSGAELVTCDAHFEGLPGVAYLPKLT